jgi:hypothetical protein
MLIQLISPKPIRYQQKHQEGDNPLWSKQLQLISPKHQEGDNPLSSKQAINTFQITKTELSTLTENINREMIIRGIREAKSLNSKPLIIANDGVIRISAYKDLPSHPYRLCIEVPGLGVLGSMAVDQESGHVEKPYYNFELSFVREILRHSSSDLAVKLIKLIDEQAAQGRGSLARLQAIEVLENQGAVVTKNGNAVIFTTSADPLDQQTKIIGVRSGVTIIKTSGLSTCRALAGSGPDLSFIFHATSPSRFKVLADAAEKFANRTGTARVATKLLLVRDSLSTFELGESDAQLEFVEVAKQVANQLLVTSENIQYRDSQSCAIRADESTQKTIYPSLPILEPLHPPHKKVTHRLSVPKLVNSQRLSGFR